MTSSGRRVRGEDPGEAAIGVILKDPKLASIAEISKPIGPASQTVAEYRALIEGLKLIEGLERDAEVARVRDEELFA